MAVHCSKCGAEVQAGALYCAVCGTAVVPGAPSPSPAPADPGYSPVNIPSLPTAAPEAASGYTPPPPPPSGYMPPPPPPTGFAAPGGYAPGTLPRRGGSGALKIVLIVVAILVGIGLLGAGAVGFVIWRVAHSIHVANRGGQFTFNSPDGRVSSSTAKNFTPEELGTDIYPGAQGTTGGMRMRLGDRSVVSAVYLTPDSKDQVLSFYKSKLGSEASVYDGGSGGAMISLKKGSQENIMVTISSRPSENDGKTRISIVHTRNKGAS
jgi:hypothetical protein